MAYLFALFLVSIYNVCFVDLKHIHHNSVFIFPPIVLWITFWRAPNCRALRTCGLSNVFAWSLYSSCPSRYLYLCSSYLLLQYRSRLRANSWYIGLMCRKTLSNRKVSATSAAASVPDEVFHRARGVQLCNIQAYQCTPAFFADSYLLNRFSSEVIANRSPVPPAARVICERHMISVVPVTRVTMAHGKRSFSFYIIGYSREVFIRDYPKKFCWGLCCCFDWLKV